jgi:hypothetical protein
LDICGFKHCLIADRDGVYDPGTPNGRLLLGLKGQLSEMELYTIRARLTAGLLNKARRGELAQYLPVGLVRDADGVVRKHPNLEVQHRLALVYSTFLQVRSASKVLQFFHDQQLRLPRPGRFGTVVWKAPTLTAILTILKNPAYAGAFVYGRTQPHRTSVTARRASQRHLPIEQWQIRLNDKYPAYISWETYEQIRAMLQDNYAEYDHAQSRGIPRPGDALLQGLVYCGACGHKMVVQYSTGAHYLCNYFHRQFGVPVCQYTAADSIDEKVVTVFFAALSGVELDAYARAMAAQQHTEAAAMRARAQQLQRLRYQAAVAQHQFEQVDPANRLVAAELERRWENALRDLQQAEATEQQSAQFPSRAEAIPADLRRAFTALGQHLPEIWRTELLSRAQKKAFLRCLIDKVVIHRLRPDCARARIVWRGGEITICEVPLRVGAFALLASGPELEQRILSLHAAGKTDREIATELTEAGFRSPMSSQLLASTVKKVRLIHRRYVSPHQSHPRRIAGRLTIPQVAQQLGCTINWLHYRIQKGRIHPLRDAASGLAVFPDRSSTLTRLRQLRAGQLQRVSFIKGEHDA